MSLPATILEYFCIDDSNLRTSRRMFWLGFCGVPVVWLLNWLNFHKQPPPPLPTGDAELRRTARLSLLFFSLSAVALIAWLLYFQFHVDDMACPCDTVFGTDMRCHCAVGDRRSFPAPDLPPPPPPPPPP
mmetsp:Transcript_19102/g.40200  ORF Transcript_19102/g.40200 Transcript_19102/m.40200 type:complete len:130 (-) Transcript_19102:5-394(-)